MQSGGLAALLGLTVACGAAEPSPQHEGPVPDLAGAHLECVYATPGHLGGLDEALAEGMQARLLGPDGALLATLTPDAAGRFSASHEAAAGEALTLEVGDAQVSFRVRDPAEALAAAVMPSLGGVGAVPNDLIVAGPAADSHGVVVRSGDNAVSPLDLGTGLSGAPLGVRLPAVEGPHGPVPAAPWFVTALDAAGTRVAVSAAGQDRVYVVDLGRGEVVRTLPAPGPVTLDQPFTLPRPADVDGDGTPEAEVSAFSPRNPQPLAVVQGRLLVAYASVVEPDRGGATGQVLLPAVVASFDLAALDAPPTVRVLEYLNPQELRDDGAGAALLTCSGAFRIQGVRAVTPGAVLRLDPVTLEVLAERAFEDLLPTTAMTAGGAIWAGSLARGQVVRIRFEDEGTTTLTLNALPVDSVFRLIALPCGLIGAPSFNTDRLHVIDPRTGTLDPAPFSGPLQVGAGGEVFEGLQVAALRPGRAGVDFVGPDLFVLSGIAARVTPVELRKVLGP
ncbi:MAG: hypothetical protein KC933_24745 [Myxococcales bacterium]|nr:hypothetical protein [Myxococcales bacterium]